MIRSIRLPSPALILACVALILALGGTAVAASPIVKRALYADNAGKIGGKSPAALVQQAVSQAVPQAAQQPGPASTAAGLVTVKTQALGSIPPNTYRPVTISCDGGAKIMAAGFSSDGPVYNFDSYPSSDTTWTLGLDNPDDNAAHNVTLYATCLK
jgi:hypothetical protein